MLQTQPIVVKAEDRDTINCARGAGERPALAVDVNEAAQLLSVSPKTVRREIARGNLRAVRVGRFLRIRTAELNAYLERLEAKYGQAR